MAVVERDEIVGEIVGRKIEPRRLHPLVESRNIQLTDEISSQIDFAYGRDPHGCTNWVRRHHNNYVSVGKQFENIRRIILPGAVVPDRVAVSIGEKSRYTAAGNSDHLDS